MKLLTTGNPKTLKGETSGYATAILHLAPSDVAGVGNVCPWARTCQEACLNTAGRGGIMKKGESTNVIQEARKNRTRFFMNDREAFKAQLVKEIQAFIRKATKYGLKPTVRLNGTSDIVWERVFPEVFQMFPEVQFYDYTKNPSQKRKLPANYSLTFSRQDAQDDSFIRQTKGNVAVVFKGELPEFYMGKPVINGDLTDLRFLDPQGVIVGLKAKGKAKKDNTGFVVNAEQVTQIIAVAA